MTGNYYYYNVSPHTTITICCPQSVCVCVCVSVRARVMYLHTRTQTGITAVRVCTRSGGGGDRGGEGTRRGIQFVRVYIHVCIQVSWTTCREPNPSSVVKSPTRDPFFFSFSPSSSHTRTHTGVVEIRDVAAAPVRFASSHVSLYARRYTLTHHCTQVIRVKRSPAQLP
jgi:hypothetical protein